MLSSARIALLVVLGAATVSAQKPAKPPKTITLSGCVERDATKPEDFKLTDVKAKKTYRLVGADFREYLGRRVQIDGGVVVKGLKISGGLQPNANIAAQAGALDPSRAAVQAATAGSTVGPTTDVQDFKVKTIRPAGACE